MRWVKDIADLCQTVGSYDVLDYGCGKSTLSHNFPHTIKQYDPAFPRYSATPEPADIVVCTDVLEHIEPEFIDDVLDDLQRVTKKVGFFTIAMQPAKKILSDGRNAHLIIENGEWWLEKLIKRFKIQSYVKVNLEGTDVEAILVVEHA